MIRYYRGDGPSAAFFEPVSITRLLFGLSFAGLPLPTHGQAVAVKLESSFARVVLEAEQFDRLVQALATFEAEIAEDLEQYRGRVRWWIRETKPSMAKLADELARPMQAGIMTSFAASLQQTRMKEREEAAKREAEEKGGKE